MSNSIFVRITDNFFPVTNPFSGTPGPTHSPEKSEGARTVPEAVLLLSGALSVYFAVSALVQLFQPCAPRAHPTLKSGGTCPS